MTAKQLLRDDLDQFGYCSGTPSASATSIRLNANENPWNAGDDLPNEHNRYPEQQPRQLVERLADIYDVDPACLLVVRGADDGIDAIIRATCRPGCGQIIQCPPTFVMYSFFARLHGVSVCNVPLKDLETGELDLYGLQAAFTEDTRAVFLCSPNNPTGIATDRQQIVQVARQLPDRIVVIDEAYIEFSRQPSVISELSELPNILVLRTLSKAFSLAGVRIGAVVGDPRIVSKIRQWYVPFPLSRPAVQCALEFTAPENLQLVKKRIARIVDQRARLVHILKSCSWVRAVLAGDANFVLSSVDDPIALIEFCAARGILIRDQSQQAGLSGCVRISVGSPDEMSRLFEVLDEFGDKK